MDIKIKNLWDKLIENLDEIVCDGCRFKVPICNGKHLYSMNITGSCDGILLKKYLLETLQPLLQEK